MARGGCCCWRGGCMHPSCILLNCACCSSLLSESAGAARRRATSRHRAAVRYAVLRFCLLVRRGTRVRGGATLRQARGCPHRASGTREQRAAQSTSATERPRAGLTRSNSRKSCEGSIQQAPQTGADRQVGSRTGAAGPSPGDDVYNVVRTPHTCSQFCSLSRALQAFARLTRLPASSHPRQHHGRREATRAAAGEPALAPRDDTRCCA